MDPTASREGERDPPARPAPGSSGADGEESLHELLAQVDRESRSGSTGARRPRRPRPFLIPSLLVLGAVVGWNLWLMAAESRRPAFTQAERGVGIQARSYLVVRDLEAIRARTGQYPASLEEANLDSPDLGYERVDGGYLLTSLDPTVPFRYRSGDDVAPLSAALRQAMIGQPGGAP